jgi:hypothetical protein
MVDARALAANGRRVTIADVAATPVLIATAYRLFLNPNDLILEAAVGTAPLSKITADLPDDRPTAEQEDMERRPGARSAA